MNRSNKLKGCTPAAFTCSVVLFVAACSTPATPPSGTGRSATNCKGMWDEIAGTSTDSWNNCFGEVRWQNGHQYSGEWQQGKKSGEGSYTWPNGQRYVGRFANDVRWGKGTQYYGPGETYTGDWKNDLRDGDGSYVSTAAGDGVTSYTGQWSGGHPYGRGSMVLRDGRKLEGSFIKYAGSGRMVYPNRDVYTGAWDADFRRTGKGQIAYANGDAYGGDWAADLRHGTGTYTYRTGRTFAGTWESGQRKRGRLTMPTGESYVGDFANDNYEGHGVYQWKNDDRYEGEWRAGVFHGRGRLNFGDRRALQDGYWENNKFVGMAEQVRQRQQSVQRKEELNKALNCLWYKANRFWCGSVPNPVLCMSTRFGIDAVLYELTCQ